MAAPRPQAGNGPGRLGPPASSGTGRDAAPVAPAHPVSRVASTVGSACRSRCCPAAAPARRRPYSARSCSPPRRAAAACTARSCSSRIRPTASARAASWASRASIWAVSARRTSRAAASSPDAARSPDPAGDGSGSRPHARRAARS